MFVLTGTGNALVNLNMFAKIAITCFCNEGVTYGVSAYPIDKSCSPSTLGEYHHKTIAEMEFENLQIAISRDDNLFCMAESLYDKEQPEVKDSRVKRRGGS